MGRGNSEDIQLQASAQAQRRNLLRRRINLGEEDSDAATATTPEPSLLNQGAEIRAFSVPLKQGDHQNGASLYEIYAFAGTVIAPREIVLARQHQFKSKIKDDRLVWHKQGGKALGSTGDYNHYETATMYIKKESAGQFYFEKSWYSNGKLSRDPSRGPALITTTKTDGSRPEKPTAEWWYHGQLIGRFEWNENGRSGVYTTSDSKAKIKGAPPEENTAWPFDSAWVNALSHCQDLIEEAITTEIIENASNPFAIEANPYSDKEEIIKAVTRKKAVNPQEVEESLALLEKRGVIIAKEGRTLFRSNGEIRYRISPGAENNRLPRRLSFEEEEREERIDLEKVRILSNLYAFFRDPSDKTAQRILKKDQEKASQSIHSLP